MSKECLDRYRVKEIVLNLINTILIKGKQMMEEDLDPAHFIECINQICKLKPKNQITKEKIIGVLESPLGKNYKAENNITLLKKLREQIASEILGEDKEE